MFRKLCGEDVLKNVILATTFWEGVDPAVGASRENELRANADFWGGMLAKGAKMARLTRSKDSALALLDRISTNEKVVLGAQDEMVNQGHSVQETSAAREESEAVAQMRQRWAAQQEAETAKMLAGAEQARVEAAMKLAQEREALRWQRESERLAENLRLAREKKEARQRHEKELQEARKERQRQEQRRRDENLAMVRKEREERERQEEREQAAAVEVVRQRTQYQSNYVCIQTGPRWPCDQCKGKVQRYTHYYREFFFFFPPSFFPASFISLSPHIPIPHRDPVAGQTNRSRLSLLRFGPVLSLRRLRERLRGRDASGHGQTGVGGLYRHVGFLGGGGGGMGREIGY